MKKLISIFAFLLFFSACEDELEVGAPANLYQEWTHAREEQNDPNDSEMIFRLTGSQTFPASHYREAYVFNADGSCEYLYLDPADAHRFREGTFNYNKLDHTLTVYTEDGDTWKRFQVQQLSEDKLVMNWLR